MTVSWPIWSAATYFTSEPAVGLSPRLAASLQQRLDAIRPGVVRGKGEQAFTSRLEPRFVEVAVLDVAEVLHAAVDVRLQLVDVADLHLRSRCRHELHDADGTDLARGALVEPGLLVPLRHHQEVVDVVPLPVLPEQLDRLLELPGLPFEVAGSTEDGFPW